MYKFTLETIHNYAIIILSSMIEKAWCKVFSKGEHVVYGTNGICLVDDIGPMRNSEDEDKLFYILRPVNSVSSVLYVPLDNSVLCGKMRYVYSKSQLVQVLDKVKSNSLDWIDDRKVRLNTFREMLHSGDIMTHILLVSCILDKKKLLDEAGKRLSDADDHVLRSAERIVSEEFAWVLDISKNEVGSYIQNYLEK